MTPNHQGSHETREELLSSSRAQDMDTSGHGLSDLYDIEFFWENPHSEVCAASRPGIDTPFPRERLTAWKWADQ